MTAEQLLPILQEAFPEAGITYGYLGNIERWGDNRSFYFFTTIKMVGLFGVENLKIGVNDPKNVDQWQIRGRLTMVLARMVEKKKAGTW